MKSNHLLKSTAGLTLVELMVVLALSLGLMATVYLTYLSQSKSERAQHQVTSMQQNLRAILEIISDDIKHAGADTGLGNLSIQGIPENTSGDSYLRMRMNTNEDNDTADANEDVAYYLNGTSLQREDFNVNEIRIISQNVTALNFTYWQKQSDGSATQIIPAGTTLNATEAEDVFYVGLSLTVRTEDNDPDTGSPVTRTASRMICRRNGFN